MFEYNIKKIKSGINKSTGRRPCHPASLAAFLLLRATKKAECNSGCKKHRITGLYLLAPTGRGYEKPQSGLRPFVRFFSATFFTPVKPLRGFFYRAQKKRHIQPERYVQYFMPKFIVASAIHSA